MKKTLLFVMTSLLLVSCCNQNKNIEPPKKNIAIQLYSVRDDINKNFDSTILFVAAAGYTQVEAAGYGDGKFYGKTPEEFKASIERAGLKILSSHVCRGLDSTELANHDFTAALAWWDTTILAHKTAGMTYLVTPCFGIADATVENMKTWCEYLNEVGRKCVENGIKYGYHNHSGEYQMIKDTNIRIYNFMLENTNPDFVFFQMDIYWTIIGDQSPVDYFNKYPGRFKMLHVKDRRELGQSGMVGFDAVFNHTDIAGVEALVVEIEEFSPNTTSAEGIKQCYDYLQNCPFVKEQY